MALDEYLYGKISTYFRKRKKPSGEELNRIVFLKDIQQRLTILARALTADAIDVFPAEREGGYKDNSLFLPVSVSMFPSYKDNLTFYFFRLLYLCTQRDLNINSFQSREISNEEAQLKARESSPLVLDRMFLTYPSMKEIYLNFKKQIELSTPQKKSVDYSWLYGKWMRCEPRIENNKQLQNISDSLRSNRNSEPTTVMKSKAVEEIIVVEVDKKQQEDYVLTHNFEKVETADEHSGVWRDFDGADELEDHQEALDELNLKYVVRVDDSTHSVYHAEFTENLGVSESASVEHSGSFLTYDEWNCYQKEYKYDFCKVYPQLPSGGDADYYHKTISENSVILTGLRKILTSINNKSAWQRRQTDGLEFDLDALNDNYVDFLSGKSPDEKIYLSKKKQEKDLSIILLLDLSLSSDGYVDGNRVIDVERQISILFGEILNEYGVDFSINGFYSKTRNYLAYAQLKSFEDKWAISRYKIGGIEASGYTRIGPALRHSGHLLSKQDSKKKWLILLSDGKPNDYDRYEGKYGIADVKQAIHELGRQNINSYALAIEKEAKYYLPQMFGQNHYQILSGPDDLLLSLVKLYERLKS